MAYIPVRQVLSNKMKDVIQSYLGHLSQQIEYFRPIMEEPSIVLAADSDVDEVDLQKVMSKIQHKKKCKFQHNCGLRTYVHIEKNIPIQSVLTDSVITCGINSDELFLDESIDIGEKTSTQSGDDGHHLDDEVRKHYKVDTSTLSSSSDKPCQKEDFPEDTSNQRPVPSLDQYLALDCEFFGVSLNGAVRGIRRCTVVDYHGKVVYDMYRCSDEIITDYPINTRYRGICSGRRTNAVPFKDMQKTVKDLVKGKILIGHGILSDLHILGIKHPAEMIIDTYTHPCMKQLARDRKCKVASLKGLSLWLLGKKIQVTGSHSPVEDATAAMDLFKLMRKEWEESSFLPNSTSDVDLPNSTSDVDLPNSTSDVDLPNSTSDIHCNSTIRSHFVQIDGSEKDEELLGDEFRPRNCETDVPETPLDSVNNIGYGTSNRNVYDKVPLSPINELLMIVDKLQWEQPDYQYKWQSSGMVVCKLLVNGEEYESDAFRSKKKAKAAATEGFFCHHRKSNKETNRSVIERLTSSDRENTSKMSSIRNAVSALNIIYQDLEWDIPVYQFERQCSESTDKFVCKLMVDGRDYQSEAVSSKTEAKEAAAQSFFTYHQRSESDTYEDVIKHLIQTGNKIRRQDQILILPFQTLVNNSLNNSCTNLV
ncbi:uncharacterized protein LOC132559374 isoform X2 [Ylistrum balloti]|uniref:uncharacterized protein LOC132559374 isoform X2 n=1 Tax=Ylistrum balloti TaxID=509963 RepID=UPI002905C561|nr:uncharacterized protein LOC132559374 isoform X2 [Ylistrum balloti]